MEMLVMIKDGRDVIMNSSNSKQELSMAGSNRGITKIKLLVRGLVHKAMSINL